MASPYARHDNVVAAFQACDVDGDGRLNSSEMRIVAAVIGFAGTDEQWEAEFDVLCSEQGIDDAGGINIDLFQQLVNDESPDGCFCTDAELRQITRDASVVRKAAERARFLAKSSRLPPPPGFEQARAPSRAVDCFQVFDPWKADTCGTAFNKNVHPAGRSARYTDKDKQTNFVAQRPVEVKESGLVTLQELEGSWAERSCGQTITVSRSAHGKVTARFQDIRGKTWHCPIQVEEDQSGAAIQCGPFQLGVASRKSGKIHVVEWRGTHEAKVRQQRTWVRIGDN